MTQSEVAGRPAVPFMIRFFRGCHLVGYTASNVRNYTAASVQLSFERSLRVEISSGKQRLIIQLLQRFTSTCILVQGRMAAAMGLAR
ncbi:hypothetical protein D3C72_2331980 [compost metagenome]